MIFKKKLPLVVCFVVGILTLFQYYIPHRISVQYLESMTQWDIIISAFAFLLGLASLFTMHYDKIRRKADGWGYSLFMFGGVILGLTCGIISKANQVNQEGLITAFGWLYNYLLNPLQGTMFALLAFYVVSASFRAFRIKSAQAFVLFIAAVILLFGRVPLGQLIWSKFMNWMPFGISEAVEWIMNFPSTAARRGIMIGIALGAVAMSLKIIFGIEKQYLGGKE
jgi:hypothetical protein